MSKTKPYNWHTQWWMAESLVEVTGRFTPCHLHCQGTWEHFNNGVNDVDIVTLVLSWIAQVTISPAVSSAQGKLVLMAPPATLRVLKVCRTVWRWCCGSSDASQSDLVVGYGAV
eukprot:4702263-Amphidinium_carterae.1